MNNLGLWLACLQDHNFRGAYYEWDPASGDDVPDAPPVEDEAAASSSESDDGDSSEPSSPDAADAASVGRVGEEGADESSSEDSDSHRGDPLEPEIEPKREGSVCEKAVSTPDPVNPKLRKFWERFVVPKHGGGKDPMSDDEFLALKDPNQESSESSGSENEIPTKVWPDDISDPMDYENVSLPKTVSPGWSLSPGESDCTPSPQPASPARDEQDAEDDHRLGEGCMSDCRGDDSDDSEMCAPSVVDESKFVEEMERSSQAMHAKARRVCRWFISINCIRGCYNVNWRYLG